MMEFFKKYYRQIGVVAAGLFLVLMTINTNKADKKIKEETSPGREEEQIETTEQVPLVVDENDVEVGGEGPDPADYEYYVQEAEKSNKDYPLWEKMPVEGEGYKIDHYVAPMVVAIYIDKGIDKTPVEKEFREWLVRNKFAENSHEIEWRER